MTKLKLFLVLAIICFITANVSAQYPRDSAINRVVKQLLVSDMGHINLYASLNIKSGSNGLSLLSDEPIKYPYNSNWVFFVDDFPYAGWNHPCRYIFIDAITGNDTIIANHHIYPAELSQDFEILSHVASFQPCAPIYSQPSPVTINGLSSNPHLFAVIIAGIEDDTAVRPPQSWNDISAVYTTLEKVYGYKPENMFVHYYNRTSVRGLDLDGGIPSQDIDYAAYKDTIHHTFRCLAGEETDPLIPKLQPDDQLLVYVDDHGDASAYHSWIMLPQDPNTPSPFVNLYDTALANWVRNIQCGQMIFVLEQCFSGGFVDDLQTHSTDKCKNRSIYTSAASNETEWMDCHISDTTYGEFIFYWTAAVRGYFPDINGNQPWATGFPVYDIVNYPLFPYNSCFDTCTNHPYYNPDLNGDGFVTMEEAFAYANDFDSWSGTGFYCPCEPTINTHPQNYKNISFQEDLQRLCGLTGLITQTQTVENRSYIVGGPIEIDGNAILSFNAAGQDTAKVYFINELADLIVSDGSRLNTGQSMIFGGIAQSQININGSINFINDVTFKTIAPGENFAGLYLNNHSIDATFSHVHFLNAGLFNNGLHLRINNNSTFINCGQLLSNYGNVNISNSTFTGTSLYHNNWSHPHNSSFIDSISSNIITASNNLDAINISNYDNFLVRNNTISGASTYYNGIILSFSGLRTSSNFNVVNNNISNCYTGISGYNSNAFIHNNHINSNYIGIKSVNFSNLQLIGEHFSTEGAITQSINNNTSYEIYSYFDFPFLRYNKIFDDNDFTGCLIYADYSEPDLLLPLITFDVRYNCWKNNSIPSQLCSSYGNNATFIYDPYFCFSNPGIDTIPVDPVEDMYKTGDSLFYAGNFVGAKNLYISLIEQYPKSRYSQATMKELFGVEQFATNDYQGLKHYYLTDDSIVADSILSKTGAFLANRCDVVLENFESAISWYEDKIQNSKFAEDSICAIIDLEAIYLQMDNGGQKEIHIGRLQQYIPTSQERYYSYRDSLLALMPFDHKKNFLEKKVNGLKPGELLQNQPNFFSITTDIYYKLASNCSYVDLEITDNLGRIRRMIHLTDITAGIHKVVFTPDELCSGMYQYSLLVDGNLTDTKKMVFIK